MYATSRSSLSVAEQEMRWGRGPSGAISLPLLIPSHTRGMGRANAAPLLALILA